jgi:hypothetical protein
VLQTREERKKAGSSGGIASGESRRRSSQAPRSKREAKSKQVASGSLEPRTRSSFQEEGTDGAPLRGGGAPPYQTPTRTLTTGRVVCAAHHQELPCISCASDAKVLGTNDDLDQRPPAATNPPPRPADAASIQLRAELAAARHTLHASGNPDHWLDSARDTLIGAGTPPEDVSATDTLLLAVDLYRQGGDEPDTGGAP